MADSIPSPENIDKLEYAVWPSYSLLAGIQLDLFTVLKDGPISVEQIARGFETLLNNWKAGLRTADSIRVGSPQVKLDFSAASRDRLAMFYRSTFAQALRGGCELAAIYDLQA